MNHVAWLLVLLAVTTSSSADDRQKAEKQVRKITAMATDKVGRRMVSMCIADSFKQPRPVIVEQRVNAGLDYGSFFVAHQLVDSGVAMGELIARLKSGKSI